jgi:hypothetical protein
MSMPNLVIDLQEGFANDRVEVRVDDRQVFAKDGVTTDPRISRADGARLQTKGPLEVRVNVLSRGLSRALHLDVSADVWVGVSIVGAELELRTADRPFFYM